MFARSKIKGDYNTSGMQIPDGTQKFKTMRISDENR